MFMDRFTDKAKRVLATAQEEARSMGHEVIGTEHILLGLLSVSDGGASRAMTSMGLSLDAVKERIEDIIPGGAPIQLEQIPMTARVKTVLTLAFEEARIMGFPYVDTEHILLGLLREGEGVAINVLRSFNVEPNKLRELVLKQLRSQGETGEKEARRPRSKNTPTLDSFGRDLQKWPKRVSWIHYWREEEIQRVIQILSRRTKNNPVLIGEPGVGKTAVVEGWLKNRCWRRSRDLEGQTSGRLDMSGVVAGSKFRGQFEERLKK